MKTSNLLRSVFCEKNTFLSFFHSSFKVQQLSKKEIEDLLRKGAYGALMEEEDEGSKFCEEDIDQILQRRTQTITIESEGKGSTFAKVKTFKIIFPNMAEVLIILTQKIYPPINVIA